MSLCVTRVYDLEALDASSVLTLLDRFCSDVWTPLVIQRHWRVCCASPLVKRWWTAAKTRCAHLLSLIGLRLRKVEDSSGGSNHHTLELIYMSGDSESPLADADIAALIRASETRLNSPYVYDYDAWVQSNLMAGVRSLELLRDYVRREALVDPNVRGQGIVPAEEGSGMAVYEVSFQAAGKSTIIYPNANLFTKEHCTLWNMTAPRPGRVYRDYMELIHTVQHDSLGLTTAANIWKKEYDACWAQMNLTALVSRNNPELYPPGLLEEIVLWYGEVARRLHERISDTALFEGFEAWRDSAGKKDPVAEDAMTYLSSKRESDDFVRSMVITIAQGMEGYYLKARLAMEAYDAGETFGAYMDTYHGPDLVDIYTVPPPKVLLFDAKPSLIDLTTGNHSEC